jgi:hypothetical protein
VEAALKDYWNKVYKSVNVVAQAHSVVEVTLRDRIKGGKSRVEVKEIQQLLSVGKRKPWNNGFSMSVKMDIHLAKAKFEKWLKTFISNAFRKLMTHQWSLLNIPLLAKNGRIVLFGGILPWKQLLLEKLTPHRWKKQQLMWFCSGWTQLAKP